MCWHSMISVWHKDFWFFKSKDVLDKEYKIWATGLKLISNEIPGERFNKPTLLEKTDLEKFLTKYQLGKEFLDCNHAMFGAIGIWSKFHLIKEAKFKVDQ